jgi:hypothetical protein
MIRTVRVLIVVAAASLIVASLIHLEVLMEGYRDQGAGIAEAVIGGVMLVGLAFTWLPGRRGRWAGVATLGFGLLGTLVGLFTVIIVGPSTLPDLVYHVALTAWLIVGVTVAWRGVSGGATTAG